MLKLRNKRRVKKVKKEDYFKKMRETGEVGVEETALFILEHYVDTDSLKKFAEDVAKNSNVADEDYINEVVKSTIADCFQYAKSKVPMSWKEERKKGMGR